MEGENVHLLWPEDDETYPNEPTEVPLEELLQELEDAIPCTARTRKYREYHDAASEEALEETLLNAVDGLNDLKLTLPLLLRYIVDWKKKRIIQNKRLQYVRTETLHSPELIEFLEDAYNPPRQHNKGIKTSGATQPLEQFSLRIVKHVFNRSMRAVAPHLTVDPKNVSEETLTVDFGELITTLQRSAPELWDLLRSLFYTPLQEKRNTMKNPNLVCPSEYPRDSCHKILLSRPF